MNCNIFYYFFCSFVISNTFIQGLIIQVRKLISFKFLDLLDMNKLIKNDYESLTKAPIYSISINVC